MSLLYDKSLVKLELNIILEQLAGQAGSDLGKQKCRTIGPSSDLEDVRLLLSQTTAAVDMINKKGTPSFSELKDVSASLERAERGGALNPAELLAIAGVLRCARVTRSYVSDDDAPTVIDTYFTAITVNKYLEDKIFGAILSEEEISDHASPELSNIRRHMRIQSAKVKDGLQKIISSPSFSKYLREPIITIRQGRYVVPVKSECKNEIPGLVHDVSSSGSTYFVEPMSAVNANNALRELEIKEKKEIERILFALSSEAAGHRETISLTCKMLLELDVIFAKAKLSCHMRSAEPAINNEGRIDLRNARHPLIDPKKVVAVSIRLGEQYDTMIITGPNTGGKTVTLKTLGLLTLMAECGLHIPAGEGSCLSVYDRVLADIGDEQSIAQSLSTFSSHMRTIVDVVDQCDDRTLVLFDELGAGTDPVEGAALAIALIEYCRNMGASVAATTHYAELKLFAMRTEGVINASCEFDVDTLQPTYKLLIGIPGKSNAFAISRKLGLSEDILNKAGQLVGKNDRDFEDVLSQLEQQRQQMESARFEAEQLRKETESIRNRSEEYRAQLEQERDRALSQARKEAQRIIEDARCAANLAAEELKNMRKALQQSQDVQNINQRQTEVRRMLNEASGKLQETRKEEKRPEPSRAIMVGDTVELLKLGTKASVIAINKDGSYGLQAGILKLTAKPDEVYLLEQTNAYQAKSRPVHSGREMKLSAMPQEIDLRGMDGIEAVCVLDRYLDEAMRSNVQSVRIIHGKGTGVLRAEVHKALKANKYIKKFRLGQYGEGEDGVTIADFK